MQYMSCGKASCVCHRNPQKKQGPYYYLSYKEGGKSQYKYLVAAMCSHIPERGEQMVRYYAKFGIMRSFNGRTREFVKLSRRCSIMRVF